ncbi:putative protein TPRXL [Panonychus citri]|uniref:putative protein TPRXL n=1 Tax=Panonychus citri TaxID=50023 RepID=UPI0023074770|nr:putative protein TPRXL [Panonychus citri]
MLQFSCKSDGFSISIIHDKTPANKVLTETVDGRPLSPTESSHSPSPIEKPFLSSDDTSSSSTFIEKPSTSSSPHDSSRFSSQKPNDIFTPSPSPVTGKRIFEPSTSSLKRQRIDKSCSSSPIEKPSTSSSPHDSSCSSSPIEKPSTSSSPHDSSCSSSPIEKPSTSSSPHDSSCSSSPIEKPSTSSSPHDSSRKIKAKSTRGFSSSSGRRQRMNLRTSRASIQNDQIPKKTQRREERISIIRGYLADIAPPEAAIPRKFLKSCRYCLDHPYALVFRKVFLKDHFTPETIKTRKYHEENQAKIREAALKFGAPSCFCVDLINF